MNYTIEQKKLFDLIAKSERKLHQDYQKFYSKLINLIESGHSERVILKWLDKELKVVDKATKKTILDATKSAIVLSTNKNTKILRSLKLQDQFKAQGLTYKPSANIWNTTNESLGKIKTIIQYSFKDGRSNLEVAKDLVSEINNDGQGVGHYKKPIKNAQRLARTEINAVYHKNDSFNWNNFDFVIGKEIRLSNSSKKNARCEICRNMAGEYPKEFVWYNWHVQCLCHSIPILLSDEEFRKYELAKLEDRPYTPPTISLPKHAIEYAKNKYFKTPPYWMENFNF